MERLASKVGVWYSTSYEYDQRDFDGIKKYGNDYHPVLGYYKSGDRKVMQTHLNWMRRAGIDFMIVDCTSSLFRNPSDVVGDKTLQLLMDLLGQQDGESRKLEFCIFIEKYLKTPSPGELHTVLEHINDVMGKHPYYFRLHGKPLAILYVNDQVNDMVRQAQADFPALEVRVVSGEPFDLAYWTYVERYPQKAHREWMPVSPSFDSSLEMLYVRDAFLATKDPQLKEYLHQILARWKLTDMQVRAEKVRETAFFKEVRQDGRTYENQLKRAVECRPDMVFLSGWNDWQFGNQIEPAKEYGFKYIDMTADLLGRTAEVLPYRTP